ncbi:hypothetical protein RD110_14035 [Rhodoferax koreense]|uniref:Uncharacterized protein n=1 Tax=Rhodoferax koreensis TaxID=1842727 RepID=A0A1P8JWP4_9BURK|nr:hypothetical protein RD110_14035 [Rhodoferax koreense]
MLAIVHLSNGAAQELLQIGRAIDSPLSDIAERVITEAGRRAGIAMQFQRMPLTRSIGLVSDGELDGDLMRIDGIDRNDPNLLRLSVSHVTAEVAAYGHSAGFEGRGRDDLRLMRFGIPKGVAVLRKYTEGLQVTETQTNATLFDMLSAGRFDVVLMTHVDAEVALRERPVPGVVRWPHAWASEPLYFVLHRRHAEVGARLERALREMQREGLPRKYYVEGLKHYDIKPFAPL